MMSQAQMWRYLGYQIFIVIISLLSLSPVVNTFQDQPDQLEAEKCDDENHLVFLKLLDVGAEGVAEEDAVLHDDDKVEEELSD